MSVYGELATLQQAYLTEVINEIAVDPDQFIGTKFCPLQDSPSHKVEWDELMAAAGMTPGVALGAESPIQVIPGVRHRSFNPGYFREKSILDENDLLLLRKPGTWEETWARGLVLRAVATLNTRLETRIEWCRWQMLAGQISVSSEGAIFTVDYNVANRPTASPLWSDTANADPLDDILSWENTYFRGVGARPVTYYFNRKVKQYLLSNAKIRDLVKERYGFSLVTDEALQKLIGDFVVYDEGRTVRTDLASAAAAGQADLIVSDASGFLAGDRVTIYDGVTMEYGVVDSIAGNTITLTANLVNAFGLKTLVTTFKPFISDKTFIIMGKGPAAEPHMDFLTVPSLYQGLDNPKPGKFVKPYDKGDEDPPHVVVVAGIYGLPRNFHPNWHVYATVA